MKPFIVPLRATSLFERSLGLHAPGSPAPSSPVGLPVTYPRTDARARWLDAVMERGVEIPVRLGWRSDHRPVAARRGGLAGDDTVVLSATEARRRLDRLSAIDAPPRHLALRDLLPVLQFGAEQWQLLARHLLVLRLCDAACPPSAGARRVHDLLLPGAIVGTAGHLATRIAALAPKAAALAPVRDAGASVLDLWLALRTLPAGSPPRSVAEAVGLAG